MTPSTQPTALASWARAIRATLIDAGCDWRALFADAGIAPESLADPDARIELAATSALWRAAVAITGDDAIGLRVAWQVNQTTFHALTTSVLVADTLADAMTRMVRYAHVVSDAADLAQGEDESTRWLDICPHTDVVTDQAIDAFAAIFVRTARGLVGRDCRPTAVQLRRPEPAHAAAFDRVFRTAVTFSAPRNRIAFARADCDKRLETANPALRAATESLLDQMLADRSRDDVPTRARDAISRLLPTGGCTQAAVAETLHMSTRSLQRKLADQGTSFRDLVDATRRELAERHLASGRCSVTEAALLLGFADTSSFSRAYKRWTGVAPSAARGGHATG